MVSDVRGGIGDHDGVKVVGWGDLSNDLGHGGLSKNLVKPWA